MNNYIIYFYDKYSIVDSFKFTTYDDFSAIKKAERVFSMIAYTKAGLYRGSKQIKRFD
ncbi:MAG: hypothetical protein K0R18_89 [Bacillales bacterium]|jgi:hypothetical protein|nr:hypothetical protein [Bacillales bacterium]